MGRTSLSVAALAAFTLLASAGSAHAQYYEEEGFYVFLDTVFTTPRNTDEVVAVNVSTAGPGEIQTQERVLSDWSADPAGRIELGYRWSGGAKVSVSYWGFDNDERTVGDGAPGNTMYFGIGPTIFFAGSYYGTFGYYGHHDIVSSIEAETMEIEAGTRHDFSDAFSLDWAVGVRYASFEETMDGFYDFNESTYPFFGDYRYAAFKSNEGEMVGVQVSARGTYVFGELLSVNAGFGYAALDGDVESASGLTPVGVVNAGFLPSSVFSAKDGDRSGNIVDFDVNVVIHVADDRYRVWLGYEHSTWDGIAVDLSRKQAALFGRQLSLGTRNDVVFSGFKIGVGFLF